MSNPWLNKNKPKTGIWENQARQQVRSFDVRENVSVRIIQSSKKKEIDLASIKRLNKAVLKKIFTYLSSNDLARLNMTCKRLRNAVQSYVTSIQVSIADWDDDGPEFDNQHLDPEYLAVELQDTSPTCFLFPDPPFPLIKKLYLCFDDDQQDIINLTKFRQLKYLKIRGMRIRLSCTKLPILTHLDIEDPHCCEKQVFRNLKNFHLKTCVESLSHSHNTSEATCIESIFTKTLDVLLDKASLEQVSYSIIFGSMSLIDFEKFVDSVKIYLEDYDEEVIKARMNLRLTYRLSEKEDPVTERRWQDAWSCLKELPNEFTFFNLEIIRL